MERAYTISDILFDNDCLILTIDNQTIGIKLSALSNKLANANERELRSFKVSPSGYGIHWTELDEDLSIPGLLDLHEKLMELQKAV